MKRLFKLIKGWWLRLIGKAEKANPRAMLEVETAEFHKASASYNENLAKQAGMIERLKVQIASNEKKANVFKARVTAAYNAKQMERAGQLALQLRETKQQLVENQQQLKHSDDLYKNLVRQREVYVKEAKRKIEIIKGKISKAEMAEAQAKLTEVASTTAFDMDGSGATLDRLEESLDERISDAQGKVRVAGDAMETDSWVMTEDEQEAMEAQALADFALEMGLESAKPAAAAPVEEEAPSRDLGPIDEEAEAEEDAPVKTPTETVGEG
jgi:phage shock protein A